MKRRALLRFWPLWLLTPAARAQMGGVAVIGHADLTRIDVPLVKRIFTGRVVELGSIEVKPVNVVAGDPLRARFLASYLKQDEDGYMGDWAIRRHSGLGVPPREFRTQAEVIRFVRETPGAIGYVDATNLAPGINVLLR